LDDAALAVGRHSLGDLLRREGDLAGSRATLEEALAVLVAAIGDDDARVTACRAALADTYVELRELEAARDQLERAVASGWRLVGADHPDVRNHQDQLNDVLRALGREIADDRPAPSDAESAPDCLLEAYGFALDRTSWRWRLTGREGTVLAEHAVALDPAAAEYQALTDLDGWLRWRPAPDRRRTDEARLTTWLVHGGMPRLSSGFRDWPPPTRTCPPRWPNWTLSWRRPPASVSGRM
jgi:Tetratricopeptide repeat